MVNSITPSRSLNSENDHPLESLSVYLWEKVSSFVKKIWAVLQAFHEFWTGYHISSISYKGIEPSPMESSPTISAINHDTFEGLLQAQTERFSKTVETFLTDFSQFCNPNSPTKSKKGLARVGSLIRNGLNKTTTGLGLLKYNESLKDLHPFVFLYLIFHNFPDKCTGETRERLTQELGIKLSEKFKEKDTLKLETYLPDFLSKFGLEERKEAYQVFFSKKKNGGKSFMRMFLQNLEILDSKGEDNATCN